MLRLLGIPAFSVSLIISGIVVESWDSRAEAAPRFQYRRTAPRLSAPRLAVSYPNRASYRLTGAPRLNHANGNGRAHGTNGAVASHHHEHAATNGATNGAANGAKHPTNRVQKHTLPQANKAQLRKEVERLQGQISDLTDANAALQSRLEKYEPKKKPTAADHAISASIIKSLTGTAAQRAEVSTNGGNVTLDGVVHSYYAKQLAQIHALRIAGEGRVYNNLKVRTIAESGE